MKQYDPSDQLAQLRSKGKSLAKLIYADEALYLQELRSSLRQAVRHAIFLLITEGNQNRLNKLSSTARDAFQHKVDHLISNCSSLLTIEQLMDLVREMEREREIKKNEAKRELISNVIPDDGFDNDPEGSISLSLEMPLDNPGFYEDVLKSLDPPPSIDDDHQITIDHQIDLHQDSETEQRRVSEINHSDFVKDAPPVDERVKGFDVIRSLFAMAGETIASNMSPENDKEYSDDERSDQSDLVEEIPQSLLPEAPLELVRWFDSLEYALTRRLRNLSHALNVELLRAGIVNSLLPVPLLDAALEGQLDSHQASSNVLKFSVPVHYSMMDQEGVEFLCILLCSSDMEFDSPQLRRCRAKLNRHQRLLLTMSRQQQHWQKRLLSQEAYQQWLGNPSGEK